MYVSKRKTPKPKSTLSARGEGAVCKESENTSASKRRRPGVSSNSELRRRLQRQLDSMAIISWYGDMLKVVAALSKREFDDFIQWDGNRSPGIATSAWPGFVGRIGTKPGKTRPPEVLPCSR